jgi:ABC-type bacteriocin/lantibiotic exporter with double-glycine peptidase domain
MIPAPWRYYAKKYRGQGWPIVAGAALAALGFLFVIPSVMLVRLIFDRAIPHADFRLLAFASMGIVALNLVTGGLSLLVRRIALKSTKRLICHVRADLLIKMYSISRRYFTETESSHIHSRIVYDSDRVDRMTTSILSDILPAAVCSVAVSVILVVLNWKLSLAIFCAGPVLLVINRQLARRVRLQVQRHHQSFHDFSHGILFMLRTIDLVRLQNTKEFEVERQTRRMEGLREVSVKLGWLQAVYGVSQQNMTAALLALMLLMGGWALASHAMTMGSLMSFYFCVSLLSSYLRELLSAVPLIMEGSESLSELHELLVIADVEPYRGTQRISFQGNISFEQVRFGYRADDFLRGVDLELPAGSRVALIGPNGCGKTTLLHLLCGFYRPRAGRLLADAHPYDDIDMSELRESIGVVMQDPILFSGTIFENLVYGSPAATTEEVEWAAQMATAHEFIISLPHAYDTIIGEGGALLSGGQRQRIAIARAILRRPRILLLDEPTNHLDVASVERVTANIHRLPDAPTIIVVSHDVHVVRNFDAVYEISNGHLTRKSGSRVETQPVS